MNLTDIIALAKQGYKPSDIKELINIAEPVAEQGQTETEPGQIGGEPETVPGDNGVELEKIISDQKAELDAIKAQLEESTKALKAAQKANIHQNYKPQSTENTDANIADWARSFM